MTGPIRQRLDRGLDPADQGTVHKSAQAWQTSATDLRTVAQGLMRAAADGASIGGQTGPALWTAMRDSAKRLEERADQMQKGSSALTRSADAIRTAINDRDAIDADLPPHQQTSYQSQPGDEELDQAQLDLKKQTHAQQQGQLAADREQQREQRAQQVTDAMEQDYQHPITVMQDIYGYEPPPPVVGDPSGTPIGPTGPPPAAPVSGPGGYDGPTGPGNDNGPGNNDGPGNDGPGDDGPGDDGPGDDDGPGTEVPPYVPPTEPPYVPPTIGPPDPGTPPVAPPPIIDSPPLDPATPVDPVSATAVSPAQQGIPGGLLGGAAAGVGAGALVSGLVRSGAIPGLTSRLSSGGVAPIGASSRIGAAGALGSTGSPAGTTATRGGVGTGGMGTGGRGTGGGRGTAGGRGAGARGAGAGTGAGGGRGRKKDRQDAADRDLFDDGEDWIDDDGAAPGTLG